MTEIGTQIGRFFFELPLWGIFPVTLGIILAAFEGGFLLGRYRCRRSNEEKDCPVGSMVAATLGLLAFMLTFTFGMAASHYTTRRHLVLDEANAIRSAYAMTQMLGEKSCTESRNLLREYVDIRLKGILSLEDLQVAIARSNAIQDRLWSVAMTGEAKGTGTISCWLYVQALNELMNMQAERINYGAHRKIPASIWVGLYGLAILGMAAMGYHAGLIGKRGFFAYLVLLIAFSLVIVLIYDIDRPRQSLFTVSQQTIIDLQQRMTDPAGALMPKTD